MSLKIYYLDDEVELCENFSDLFSGKDLVITTFTDPSKAIEMAKNHPPDLFFLDFRLPSMTGDKVAQLLDGKIPKFLITGDIAVETQYPFIKIISKPYRVEDIDNIIQQYFHQKNVEIISN
jgi:CheY-like chemotaxis protein